MQSVIVVSATPDGDIEISSGDQSTGAIYLDSQQIDKLIMDLNAARDQIRRDHPQPNCSDGEFPGEMTQLGQVQFERAVVDSLGDKIRASQSNMLAVFNAISGVRWKHHTGLHVLYDALEASAFFCHIRGDTFTRLASSEATSLPQEVRPWIKRSMADAGWGIA